MSATFRNIANIQNLVYLNPATRLRSEVGRRLSYWPHGPQNGFQPTSQIRPEYQKN